MQSLRVLNSLRVSPVAAQSYHSSSTPFAERAFNKRKPSQKISPYRKREKLETPIQSVAFHPTPQGDEVVEAADFIAPTYEYVGTLPNSKELWAIPKVPKPLTPAADRAGVTTEAGHRKRARATVHIRSGTGNITINGRPFTEYFGSIYTRARMLEPILAADLMGILDIQISVSGGGIAGQSLAIHHVKRDPEYRFIFRHNRMLNADIRQIERKHTGLRKARKRQQWVKR